MPLRRTLAPLSASILLLLAAATTALAAFQTVQLSATSAPVGTAITGKIEISGRATTENPSALYLVPQAALDADESAHCDDVTGAAVVGQLAWVEAPVESGGTSYPGFVADVAFTVPEVPWGVYYLAESIEAAGTGCHAFAQFGVGVELPDTATGQPSSFPVAGVLLTALAILSIGRARRGTRVRASK
jgi:hypothetical protein